MGKVAEKITLKHVIGFAVILVFSISHITTLWHVVPVSNEGLVNHSLGILDAVTTAIIFYYFGSSSGSKAKSETIEELKKEGMK
jgi:dihydrodipicolinate synthase/N-acetylneuraminate lyase